MSSVCLITEYPPFRPACTVVTLEPKAGLHADASRFTCAGLHAAALQANVFSVLWLTGRCICGTVNSWWPSFEQPMSKVTA
jgi:hypothetical protein